MVIEKVQIGSQVEVTKMRTKACNVFVCFKCTLNNRVVPLILEFDEGSESTLVKFKHQRSSSKNKQVFEKKLMISHLLFTNVIGLEEGEVLIFLSKELKYYWHKGRGQINYDSDEYDNDEDDNDDYDDDDDDDDNDEDYDMFSSSKRTSTMINNRGGGVNNL